MPPRRSPPLALAVATAALALAAALAASCLEGHGERPEGSRCSSDSDCREGLRCEYGRCRAECSFDADCEEDEHCVPVGSGAGGVCFGDEESCPEEGCPPGFECVDGECVETPADGDGDADLDGDGDADLDGDAEVGDGDGDGDDAGETVDGDLDGDGEPLCLDLGVDPDELVAPREATPLLSAPVPVRELAEEVLLRGGPHPRLDGTAGVRVNVYTESCAVEPAGSGGLVEIAGRVYCLVAASEIDIDPTMEVGVSGPNPLVLLARERVVIGGTLTASADGAMPGPGGERSDARGPGPCRGADGASCATGDPCVGGSGGGLYGAGGQGGCDGPAGHPSCVGCAYEGLLGGSAGGIGGARSIMAPGGLGGGGGGALYLLSLEAIEVSPTGSILSNGGNGEQPTAYDDGGSGGGGSGGTIVLEAPMVAIEGHVAALGGSGGSAGFMTEVEGGEGGRVGHFDGLPAGCAEAVRGPGGGGGVGRLFVRTFEPFPAFATDAVVPDLGACVFDVTGCISP